MGNAQSDQGFLDFMGGFKEGFSSVPIVGTVFDAATGGSGSKMLLIGGAVVVGIILLK